MGFPGGSPACNVGGRVESLGWEDLLEKKMATHSSILAWGILWMEEAGRGVSESDMTERPHFTFMYNVIDIVLRCYVKGTF